MALNPPLNRKLRMGIVGGGIGSFIGRVHTIAAALDHRCELVAGAFSSNPEKSKQSAPDYGVDESRAYGSYEAMLDAESRLPADQRIDFVSVTTPNHTHFEIAKAAVEAGFNVVCDKPMTLDLDQAEQLLKTVENSDVVFALTHNYTGYPLIRQAREMIMAGELGKINAIRTQYIQGWLAEKLEATEHKQAAWRTDPAKSGVAGAFGDIATHAFNLGRYVTGELPDKVSCHLKAFVDGRRLDDYGTAVIRYKSGALGTVTASQISHGRENDLEIEVDGTLGSLRWRQENPNEMIVRKNGQPHQIYTRDPNADFTKPLAASSSRIPAGHPEGFFCAFANIYLAAFDDMAKRAEGQPFERRDTVYPNVYDGVEGMMFIEQCVKSSEQDAAWLTLSHSAART
ncbi:Predicted dehydrogenase [Neorhodopirellula lusitana]|uniref:Predicted dehydrogenase n=1 Tax=Neorhodopirellula lusitana TaxID=445327 RepID=A0ABY1PP93_9BACT|nr:Gfo/Idh/MocA family oxidoreductase [Neorhodopirellula lusitana]SMP38420.1 Predicted dehydrogenase [Neorhodopirellula lusitana]